MMSQPRILAEAAEEVAAAAAFLDEERPGQGGAFLRAYAEKLRQLVRFPESGPLVANLVHLRTAGAEHEWRFNEAPSSGVYLFLVNLADLRDDLETRADASGDTYHVQRSELSPLPRAVRGSALIRRDPHRADVSIRQRGSNQFTSVVATCRFLA